ncbi:MAG: glycosyl hydrolase [Bacteroidota bacterium]|nr:glycosyl hydrolase [Bacteroidota bacterium]
MRHAFFLFLSLLIVGSTHAQDRMTADTFEGMAFRNIGPGFMSGRIADIAIHPDDDSVWYVAVGSGNVWKTVNNGTTWTPIFDDQASYSIGNVELDPSNPNIVWVGTGEDVGGRHVGYGDGIYRSEDGGQSWTNMGLTDSQHISIILVHPDNSDVVWVAAQGPLWASGGDRGLYMTEDGGQTWTKTLGDDEWVSVTDIELDPRNPDVMYAATWQRHRTVAKYLGGGPGSGIHKSTDGGKTWTELTHGLPESNMGKIGLAVSPHDPDVVYAAIELDRKTGGVFMSTDRGASWTKQSDAVAGATGPHYYQELFASPHHEGRLYLMDASMQVSEDHGKTFYRMNEQYKHGDNHAIAFKPNDPDYVLFGTDGGLYETFDLEKSWKFVENLPVTQYYKVAVDDAEPFYNIYGGTQDNSTQGGPSRTDNVHGIQNSDWKIVLNWDGHQPATEPGNPDIMYAERQEGAISRVDLTTGEVVDIQPQPGEDEGWERYNWDAPILVSPHKPSRIYFASQRVWKSENRGDDWTAVSGDLTRNQDRFELDIMGGPQRWDNAWDVAAMSNYNTITSLAESPVQEGVLYAGTDDGLVQVSEDGGANWRAIEVGSIRGVPATAFVNDIKADLYDAGTVYVALDNHKYGDFSPYLVKSTDFGRSWSSIRGNLPDRTLVWRLVQDHGASNLMCAGTEFGVYFTVDGGKQWTELSGSVPTISFRDLAIQRRENDLVGASFGRGFFVLDDYSALRQVSAEQLEEAATLFPTRDAWWYIPRPQLSFDEIKGSQGDAHYVAPNPPFGAVFTYYLKEDILSAEAERQAAEKKATEAGQAVGFPGWDTLDAESMESPPMVMLAIGDADGQLVRLVEGPATQGFHRVAWDLRYPSPEAVVLGDTNRGAAGMLTAPGTYTVTLMKREAGTWMPLSEAMWFTVKPLHEGALEGASHDVVAAFWRRFERATRNTTALTTQLSNAMKKATSLETALARTPGATTDLAHTLSDLHRQLVEMEAALNGSPSKREVGENSDPTISTRLFAVQRGIERSTYGPTTTHREQLEIVESQTATMSAALDQLRTRLDRIGAGIVALGGPWVER